MVGVRNKIFPLLRTEDFLLIVVLVLSAMLRFWDYGAFSYSNDELSAIARAQFHGFGELVEKGFYVDGHPGGIQVFLWLWIKAFPMSEWSVRLPFVLMGIASVWMSYKVSSTLFGKVSGLFVATTIGFLQFSLLYSQIARPYGPGMLFSLMLIYFWLKIFYQPQNTQTSVLPRHYVWFSISAALCMYTHYFSFLFALIVGLSGFFFCRKDNCKYYILSALAAALLFVPHIYITLNHLTFKGLSGWLAIPGKYWIFEHFYFVFDESIFTILIVSGVIVSLLTSGAAYKSNYKYRIVLFSWFITPIFIGYIYSLQISPILQHPVLIFSFPGLIILLFSFNNPKFTTKRYWILVIYLVVGFSGTVWVNKYYSKQHFGEFRQIATKTIEYCAKYDERLITKVASINNPYYLDFYFNTQNKSVPFNQYELNTPDDLTKLANLVSTNGKPYFLLAVTKPTSSEAEGIIRSMYPFIAEYVDYGGMSSIALYSKTKGITFAQNYNLVTKDSFQFPPSFTVIQTGLNGVDEHRYVIDSLMEYSKGLDTLLSHSEQIAAIQAELDIAVDEPSGSVLVISIESPQGESVVWQGSESKRYETIGVPRKIICTYFTESEIQSGSKLKVYLWNKEKRRLVCSKMKVLTLKRNNN